MRLSPTLKRCLAVATAAIAFSASAGTAGADPAPAPGAGDPHAGAFAFEAPARSTWQRGTRRHRCRRVRIDRRGGRSAASHAPRRCAAGRANFPAAGAAGEWGPPAAAEPAAVSSPPEAPPTLLPAVPSNTEGSEPGGTPEQPEQPQPPPVEEPGAEPEEPEAGEPPAEEAGLEPTHFRFFAPTSIWNTPVPAAAPLDPDSTAIVGAFDDMVDAELQAKSGPSINTTEFSVPVYTVPADQPTVEVHLTSGFAASALRSAWHEVPLPPDAQPSRGNDKHLVVWQPSTDRLWEFWELAQEADGWQGGWGGAMLHASSNAGVYDSEAWPGSTRFWGASATSLSIAGGLITFEDLQHKRIEHALSMSIPNVRAGVYSSPAQRGDGKTADPLALPQGAHLRLDPTLDLNSLHLPEPTLILARAAQRYGIFVRDGARNVTFQAQDPTATGSDPYRGAGGFWEGSYPRAILSAFPWHRLQLLQMDLHPSPGS